ncbi:hypothetical protein [Duganella sacchari]|uniref:hypothetical protein n=1 Tax=Duganella sacchari TaxID=551987 RepID=UPI001AD80748|nr:hypothetical protein [Duganella sacchari]
MTDLHHLNIPEEPGDAMAAALALRELAVKAAGIDLNVLNSAAEAQLRAVSQYR